MTSVNFVNALFGLLWFETLALCIAVYRPVTRLLLVFSCIISFLPHTIAEEPNADSLVPADID